MKIFESILDNVEAGEFSASSAVSSDSTANLPDPFKNVDEFDLLLSIPVTFVEGKDYNRVMQVKNKLYDFLDLHPAIIAYSRIIVASWYNHFSGDDDIRPDISNRIKKYDPIFFVAIKMNFRTFIDVASFVSGINSIVRRKDVYNSSIQFLRKNEKTGIWYNDWDGYNDGLLSDQGIECSYFGNDACFDVKKCHMNKREFCNLIDLCYLLTKGNVTMNIYNKVYARRGFGITEAVYELLNNDTLRDVRIEGLRNFIIGNQLNSINFGNNYYINLGVSSYFQVVPVDKICESSWLSDRYAMGYPDSSYSDERRLAIKNYLQEKFDSTEIKSFSFERIYLRGQTTNAPVKLILWLDV